MILEKKESYVLYGLIKTEWKRIEQEFEDYDTVLSIKQILEENLDQTIWKKVIIRKRTLIEEDVDENIVAG